MWYYKQDIFAIPLITTALILYSHLPCLCLSFHLSISLSLYLSFSLASYFIEFGSSFFLFTQAKATSELPFSSEYICDLSVFEIFDFQEWPSSSIISQLVVLEFNYSSSGSLSKIRGYERSTLRTKILNFFLIDREKGKEEEEHEIWVQWKKGKQKEVFEQNQNLFNDISESVIISNFFLR